MTTTMTRPPLTATQIIHGIKGAENFEHYNPLNLPVHPALAVLAWEDERTDVHGVGCRESGRNEDGHYVKYACHCGYTTAEHPTDLGATAALISHALKSCAVCHGPKGMPGNFPRCSGCAF